MPAEINCKDTAHGTEKIYKFTLCNPLLTKTKQVAGRPCILHLGLELYLSYAAFGPGLEVMQKQLSSSWSCHGEWVSA